MLALPEGDEKKEAQESLRQQVVPGFIDVNIMTKLDRTITVVQRRHLWYSDALTALQAVQTLH